MQKYMYVRFQSGKNEAMLKNLTLSVLRLKKGFSVQNALYIVIVDN